jgi:hypothetical protein
MAAAVHVRLRRAFTAHLWVAQGAVLRVHSVQCDHFLISTTVQKPLVVWVVLLASIRISSVLGTWVIQAAYLAKRAKYRTRGAASADKFGPVV